MARRDDRKGAIRSIVRSAQVRTQKDLVEHLQADGFDCTQATVSRDIAELGLLKAEGGYYALPEDIALRRLVSEMVLFVEEAGNLVVVKTRSGGASMVCEVLDNADIDGLVGTIAGENTIMAAAKTEARAAQIASRLRDMMAKPMGRGPAMP